MAAGLLAANQAKADGAVERRPLQIVASFSILADVVKEVGGDRVRVTSLVGRNGDAHTYIPSQLDSVAIARADLLVRNGLGYDDWMEKLANVARTTAPLVVVTKNIRPLMISPDHDHGHSHGHSHNHSHDGEVPDPHHWHDPRNLITVARTVQEVLAEIDPEGATDYRLRADDYVQRLEALDAWAKACIETIPPENRKIVTSHDSLGYLANRYGLRVVTTALGSLTTEAADPSAGQLARVIRAVRQEKVPAIFVDSTSTNSVMDRIAEEAGVRLATRLYTDALGAEDSPVSTTLGLFRHNITVITKALGGTP
jgi:zinc/manganese transport system substrate-binding protein